MVFGAGRAVAFAGVFVAQAGQLVASADAITVARLRGGLDGDEWNCRRIARIPLAACKRVENRKNWARGAGVVVRGSELSEGECSGLPKGKTAGKDAALSEAVRGFSVEPGGTGNRGVPAVPPSAVLEWS